MPASVPRGGRRHDGPAWRGPGEKPTPVRAIAHAPHADCARSPTLPETSWARTVSRRPIRGPASMPTALPGNGVVGGAPGAVRDLSIWRVEIGGARYPPPTETVFFRGSGSVREGRRRISPHGAACAGPASWERRVFQTLVSRPQMGWRGRRRSMRAGRPRLEDAPFPGRRAQERSREACPAKTPPRTCLRAGPRSDDPPGDRTLRRSCRPVPERVRLGRPSPNFRRSETAPGIAPVQELAEARR